jgi:tRNA threonylcarbamoyladenosine biosynthesis protein TsaE
MKACFELPDEQTTQALAHVLASELTFPLVLTFDGALGTGKTTLIRGILRALGVTGAIKSPTFSLVESYPLTNYIFHHFDLYRLSDETELEAVGFRDYFAEDTICCIEWPTRAPCLGAFVDLTFELEMKGEGRQLTVTAVTDAGKALLDCLRRKYR